MSVSGATLMDRKGFTFFEESPARELVARFSAEPDDCRYEAHRVREEYVYVR